jgi:hypothetical protein
VPIPSPRAAGCETYHHGKRGNTALLIQARFEHNKYLDDKAERLSGEPGKQIVDEAIRFLREPHDRPVFMYLAFGNPHDPRVAARRYLDLYDPARIPLPGNFLPVHPFDNGEMVIRDELLAPWPRTPEEIRRQLAEYWAVVTGLDENIGRLIDCMKESGIYENTIIVFSSDQGIALGSHGLMGKQNLYEDSMRVPLVIRGPGIRPGATGAMVYLMDIFPTILDLAGAAAPHPCHAGQAAARSEAVWRYHAAVGSEPGRRRLPAARRSRSRPVAEVLGNDAFKQVVHGEGSCSCCDCSLSAPSAPRCSMPHSPACASTAAKPSSAASRSAKRERTSALSEKPF